MYALRSTVRKTNLAAAASRIQGSSSTLRSLRPIQQVKHFSTSNDEKDLASGPLAPDFVENYKLDDPARLISLSVGTGLFASLTGIYHLNEETQILGVFIVFVSTVYAKGGDAIGKMFDETSEAILKEHNALEDVSINSNKMLHEAYVKQASLSEDVQSIYGIQKEMADTIVKTHNRKLKHEVRNALQRRLEQAVNQEERVAEEAKQKLVTESEAFVRAQFASADGKKLKGDSITAALASLGAKGGKSTSVVGSLYEQYFVQAKKDLEKAGKTPTKSALEEQIEALMAEASAEAQAAKA